MARVAAVMDAFTDEGLENQEIVGGPGAGRRGHWALRQTFLETATHDTQAFLARVRARLVD